MAALIASAAFRATLAPAGERTPTEYEVKAVYLLNFARFVEWPDGAFASGDAPFTICVLGTNPFASALDEVVAGEVVAGRRLVARHITQPADASGCQIVFAAETVRLPALIDAVAERPILTVGDDAVFTQRGGMISFRLEQSTVRIDVNPERLRRAGLSVRSQLLSLARIVTDQS